jgi:hypothetical protein
MNSSFHYPLFHHFSVNHGLTLLDSELDEICRIVKTLSPAHAAARPDVVATGAQSPACVSARDGGRAIQPTTKKGTK